MNRKQARLDVAIVLFGLMAFFLALIAGILVGNTWFGLTFALIVALLLLLLYMVGERGE